MEKSSQLLVQLTDLLLEDLQVLQCHFQEPSVHVLELRARAERITQLFRRRPQPLMGQNGHCCGISFSVSQSVQHAPCTGAKQIGDQTGQPVSKGCVTLANNRRARSTRERTPAVKNISTVATNRNEIFKDHKLTIRLDLGDRSSHFCILDEAR